jgi:hypothetical protein
MSNGRGRGHTRRGGHRDPSLRNADFPDSREPGGALERFGDVPRYEAARVPNTALGRKRWPAAGRSERDAREVASADTSFPHVSLPRSIRVGSWPYGRGRVSPARCAPSGLRCVAEAALRPILESSLETPQQPRLLSFRRSAQEDTRDAFYGEPRAVRGAATSPSLRDESQTRSEEYFDLRLSRVRHRPAS